MYREELQDEMYNRRQKSFQKLSTIVHPKYAEEFMEILSYAWHENHHAAEKIADLLDFGPIEFVAVHEDIKEFENLYLRELEYAQNF